MYCVVTVSYTHLDVYKRQAQNDTIHCYINNVSKPVFASSSNCCSLKLHSTNNVLLSTAIVFVIDQAGNRQLARVLLDAGSQINFYTESFVKKLRLNLTKSNIQILDTVSYTHLDVYKRQKFERYIF